MAAITLKLPGNGGNVIFHGTQEEADHHLKFLHARYDFFMAYCREKGWPADSDQLSIPQILEVRDQPGWLLPDGFDKDETNVVVVTR